MDIVWNIFNIVHTIRYPFKCVCDVISGRLCEVNLHSSFKVKKSFLKSVRDNGSNPFEIIKTLNAFRTLQEKRMFHVWKTREKNVG